MADTDLRIGILTCSSDCARGDCDDALGQRFVEVCEARGWLVVAYHVCRNNSESVGTSLIEMTEVDEVNVVLTLGGTGLAPSDVVPEAMARVCERSVPGIAEAIHARISAIDPWLMMSRATAGIRGRSLIINLPDAEKPALDAFEFIAGQLERAVAAIESGGIIPDE